VRCITDAGLRVDSALTLGAFRHIEAPGAQLSLVAQAPQCALMDELKRRPVVEHGTTSRSMAEGNLFFIDLRR
jgi:hypothetical protein